ncbi:ATP phosphoribosyltransferase [Methermicoccus shengliensis]|uniref:ATP phosphoribosyltransferase n=1 Tax=Methermicoccus shengliensis TaxID=660064 RepID=A0A832RS28_9EURY|nr:ATP phosphoribosyltransferase [Methermicoccus shengliensis]KUK04463.1 MAG: ATP phosphoribosyltransferase [Euryarchaeota archaeon 55_53]KUK30090.1 MAG: ATP phosphoribosyltransferase [Methanosarcinales archeaon 56_1174]MDI3487494.1 phosphoribosyltransferase [Methanosarcinales archaeon]MDN5295178.1 phosphoribosyltransferase [Methanosarcinales archaeon]HIH69163.1 ATP phosphoribosyltransferase [Methermicoccus shengliensis]
MLSLALPKGSLEQGTLELFREADLEIMRTEREYNPRIADPRIGKVKILRPQEIPTYVQEGYFDLGISGLDWVLESGADVVEVADLPYSKAGMGKVRLVVAVHGSSPWQSARDIPDNARVSTEYPRLTTQFFERLGKRVHIVYSYGATEAKVPELVDVAVDLTETGATLIRNGLKIIDVVLESTTKLIANRASWSDPEKRREIEEIRTLLLGVIDARGRVMLKLNVPAERLDDVVSALPAMKRPTISQLYDDGYYAVETIVPKSEVNVLIPRLKALGAEDIVELKVYKVVH